MRTVETIEDAVAAAAELRKNGATLALVPTMGNLHQGHLTLVREARKLADHTAVSIFVNPLQFNNREDLRTYPRTPEADLALLEAEGADLVFLPRPEIMYPQGLESHTTVFVPGLSDMLEGALRPGHFRGVTTVVCKLFNIFRPDCAMFGLKDFQQVAVLKKMVRDMCLGVRIVEVPIVRDEGGLALSSRNGLLSEEEKIRARKISQRMFAVRDAILAGRRDYDALAAEAVADLNQVEGFATDSVDIVNADTLEKAAPDTRRVAVLMAVKVGPTRLIDSVAFDL